MWSSWPKRYQNVFEYFKNKLKEKDLTSFTFPLKFYSKIIFLNKKIIWDIKWNKNNSIHLYSKQNKTKVVYKKIETCIMSYALLCIYTCLLSFDFVRIFGIESELYLSFLKLFLLITPILWVLVGYYLHSTHYRQCH